MAPNEKGVILAALMNYEIAIKDSLTQEEHTTEEIQNAFDTWNMVTKLIKKYSK